MSRSERYAYSALAASGFTNCDWNMVSSSVLLLTPLRFVF
jgi:hypothetical protein